MRAYPGSSTTRWAWSRFLARVRAATMLLARVREQAEVLGQAAEPDRRQVLLALGHPGDREGVARVALAGAAAARPLPAAQVRRRLPDLDPGGGEGAGRRGAVRGGALHADEGAGAEAPDPGDERRQALGVAGERPLVDRRPDAVDRARGERALVRVDPHHCHCASSVRTMGAGRPGSSALRFEGHAPMRPRPARSLPGWGHLLSWPPWRGHYVAGPTHPVREHLPTPGEGLTSYALCGVRAACTLNSSLRIDGFRAESRGREASSPHLWGTARRAAAARGAPTARASGCSSGRG